MIGTTGVQRFIYQRGQGASRRAVHLAGFDRLSRFSGALCGARLAFDTSCNLPLGRPVCRRCAEAEARIR
jgi:hypothetical protein